MATGNNDAKVRTCRICGDTAPAGKDLCWCCEHKSKLHKADDSCDGDKCKIDFKEKDR